MIYQAHRGLSSDLPENTMPSFLAAKEWGYGIIELDVSVTKDMQFVVLHDDFINRTARLKSGEELPVKMNIADLTYFEANEYDYGIWFSKKFMGTKIPLLIDVLKMAAENNIQIKIDNKYNRFTHEEKKELFKLIKPYCKIASLTCSSIKEVNYALDFLPDIYFQYDGEVTEEILISLRKILSHNRLTVWLPLENQNTHWVKIPFANKSLAEMVKRYARLGLWLLSDENDLENAEKFDADVIETNGTLKPFDISNADMHTHSENSHDSVCKIMDMCIAEKEKGTNVFAVTDHCDIDSFRSYDIYTPIKKSFDAVQKLNQEHNGKLLMLSGVEISEGIWFPDELEKITKLCKYDVVIGSVHCVKYKNSCDAYSKIDFSRFTVQEIYNYLDLYFNDVLRIAKEYDIDILAHLTCPIRYITGKYNIKADISRFYAKIEEILSTIIKREIALEVNTSGYNVLNDFIPNTEILKKYHNLGGYLLTLGSDAHIADNASTNFDIAKQTLKEIGFEKLYLYKKRVPYKYTIK